MLTLISFLIRLQRKNMVATLIQITAWVIRLDDVMADNNSPTAITFNSEHTINLLRWIACKKSILTKHSSEIRYLFAWWNDPVKRFDKGGIWKSKLAFSAFHFVLHISYLLFSPSKKCGKFWSVWPGYFIKQNHLFSEEWI